MNELLDKFTEFKILNNYEFNYYLDNGDAVSVKISQYNFPHLIGLQKLVDIGLISRFNDKLDLSVNARSVVRTIKKELIITENTIKRSSHFYEIDSRYNNFNNFILLFLLYKSKFIDFNGSSIGSSIKSKYLLVTEINNTYYHLGLKGSLNNSFCLETFFVRNDNLYIANQNTINVNSLKIITPLNKVINIR